MKNIKKFRAILEIIERECGESSNVAVMLKEALIEEDNYTPRGGIRPVDYVARDKYTSCYRPIIGGVHYENGHIVATDAIMLIDLQNQEYSADFEGKTISPKGREIEGKYPAWASVIPALEECLAIQPNWNDISAQVKAARMKGVKDNENEITLCKGVVITAPYAKKLLEMRKMPGITYLGMDVRRRCILVEGPNFRAVCMQRAVSQN